MVRGVSKERMSTDPHDLNRLAAHIEGRLDADEQAAVLEHAAHCRACRDVLAALAREAVAGAASTNPVSRRPSPLARARVLVPIAAMLTVATVALLLVLRVADDVRSGPPGGTAPGAETPAAPPPATPLPSPASPPSRDPASTEPSPAPRGSGSTSGADAGLLVRRSGERRIGSKSFHLAAGEWIDGDYDPLGGLPVTEVTTTEARAALIRRIPALRPYAALGPRLIVVHDGIVYRFAVTGQ